MLMGMQATPGTIEGSTEPERGRGGAGIPRLIGAALKRERRRTAELLDGLLGAIKAEISVSEEQVQGKLGQIDVSLNLIAQELARRKDDGPTDSAR